MTTPAGMSVVETQTSERVADVMLTRPKTLPVSATVGDVRAMFANVKVQSALLIDGDAFAGMLDREDVPGDAAPGSPARRYARIDVERVHPDTLVADAWAWLDARHERRLVVVDPDGRTLRGLLCLNRRRTGFCTD